MYLCIAILACLQERQRSGRGQMIDIGMLDCQIAVQENAFVRYLSTGDVPRPLGTRHPVFTPFQVFQTRDGYVAVAIGGGLNDQWPLFCAAIGHVDLIDDARFKDGWERTQHYAILEPIMSDALRGRSTGEWLAEFEQAGIACGPVNTIDKVVDDPQTKARNMVVEVHHPSAGSLRVTNTPVRLSRTPPKIERAAPELGEHTDQVLESVLGMTEPEIRDLREQGII